MPEPAKQQNGRTGKLVAINRSGGGLPKLQVGEARITEAGLEGDQQRDTKIHGGPDRAVTLFSIEAIESMAREGHPIGIGSTGENLTVSSLDWSLMVPGAELRVGEVRLRITKFTMPCVNVQGSFASGDASRISQEQHPGWSRVCARVLSGGVVRTGDSVVLL